MRLHSNTNFIRFFFCLTLFASFDVSAGEDYQKERSEMVNEIEQEVNLTSSSLRKASLEKKVVDALLKVPRHEFVPPDQRPYAYENRPLPIGHGQTISQPYIVAIMTDLLKLEPAHRVLEIGTGSGYQAAILAELVSDVYTIEIIGVLADQAKERFKRLGYEKIKTHFGDGYYGWGSFAPFDAIVVTAAADHVPPPLIQQLKPGGRMIIPVGGKFTIQQLVLIEKDQKNKVTLRQILPVQFVPLTRGQ